MGSRRSLGAVATPPDIADSLVGLSLRGWRLPPGPPVVLDPACGDGALLLAAARRLLAEGVPADTVVGECLWGVDVDPGSARRCRSALEAWALDAGATDVVAPNVVIADALLDDLGARGVPRVCDVVLANPPYLSALATETAASSDRRAALRGRFGDAVTAYADSAALFGVLARRLVGDGGRVGLLVPASLLGARDAGPARAEIMTGSHLRALWQVPENCFGAAVEVVGIVVAPGTSSSPVTLAGGHDASVIESVAQPTDGGWTALLASAAGVPPVALDERRILADVAAATAGFRNQYYGIVDHVHDQRDGDGRPSATVVPLVTVGSVRSLGTTWGVEPVRFARRRWAAPVVDCRGLEATDAALARWGRSRLVPKVVLAPQGKVPVVAVDTEGRWWPSVPLISIEPHRPDGALLWRLAAALSSPPVAAWAVARTAGTGLAAGRIRLSAKEASSIPLPVDDSGWSDAAAMLRTAVEDGRPAEGLRDVAAPMTHAYGLEGDHPCLSWWLEASGVGA